MDAIKQQVSFELEVDLENAAVGLARLNNEKQAKFLNTLFAEMLAVCGGNYKLELQLHYIRDGFEINAEKVALTEETKEALYTLSGKWKDAEVKP